MSTSRLILRGRASLDISRSLRQQCTRTAAQPHRGPAQSRSLTSQSVSQCLCTARTVPRKRLVNEQITRRVRVRSKHSIPFTGSVVQNAKILFRYYPFSMTLATLAIVTCVAILGAFNWWYYKYFAPAYHNFPEPVAKHLRRAIYYTNQDLQPPKAIEYYEKALEAARDERMDPFGDEVIGIKLQMAALLEKSNAPLVAIRVLEAIRTEIVARSEEALTLTELTPTLQQQRRSRLLARSIGIALKEGELYSSPYVAKDDKALEILLWAVNTVLREGAAREAAGATNETHGAWLTADEFGATLESLATRYEADNVHFLAAPLYLQALAAKSATDCHSVVLMNNLSACLAQQSPPVRKGVPPPSREALVQSAREWAARALTVAGEIAPPVRDDECDVGCAVALHNLGEFAEMLGDRVEAGKKYKEAVSLARAVGFSEGVERSSARLRKLREVDAIRN